MLSDPRASLRARNIHPLTIERTSQGPLPADHYVLPSLRRIASDGIVPTDVLERALAPEDGHPLPVSSKVITILWEAALAASFAAILFCGLAAIWWRFG